MNPNTHTLASMAPLYINWCEGQRQKPSAIRSKRMILDNHILPLLGAQSLDSIGVIEFDLVKARLRHFTAKTVNNILSALRALLVWANHRNYRTTPVPPSGWVKVVQPEIKCFTSEEFELLVSTAKEIGPVHYLICLLGGDAGMRPGEVRGLHWSSVDLRTKMIKVEKAEWKGQYTLPKGNDVRTVPMSARLYEALVAHSKKKQGALVLTHPDKFNVGLTQCSHTLMLRKVEKRAGLDQLYPHSLRHTFCTTLAERNAPPSAIQHLAGHKDLKTTQRYTHVREKNMRDAIDLLGPKKGES